MRIISQILDTEKYNSYNFNLLERILDDMIITLQVSSEQKAGRFVYINKQTNGGA